MHHRPYPRPFVRAQSPVRSRLAAGSTLSARLRFLRRGHRRALSLALLLSAIAHVLLWMVIPEPEPYRPNAIVGYEGPIRVLEIDVVHPEVDQEILAEQRRRSGALVATEIQTEEGEESRSPRDRLESDENEPTQPAETEFYVVEAPPTVAAAEPDVPIRIELREDLTVDTRSSAAARSLDIKLLWVVRPDYPRYARRNGIEGLVRLEAEVGITGKVLDVHVLESPDGGLALAASRSLLLWEFQPLSVNGRLRRFRVIVPFRFTLLG